MELDDLRTAWAAHGAALDRSVAIGERLLRETLTGKARAAAAPSTRWRVVELVVWLALLVGAGSVLGRHLGEPRYVVAGGALVLYLAAIAGRTVHLLVATARLDYDAPVTATLRAVSRLRRAEVHTTTWAIGGGVVTWLPAALVGFEAVTGVPVLAHVDLAWLAANLALGVLVLIVAVVWVRRNVDRAPRSRVVDALSGRALRDAERHLADLAAFERDEPVR